jgi:hypothetical protein
MNPPPPAGPASGGGLAADLANPKSQIWNQLFSPYMVIQTADIL